jgi:hypothetical protein
MNKIEKEISSLRATANSPYCNLGQKVDALRKIRELKNQLELDKINAILINWEQKPISFNCPIN